MRRASKKIATVCSYICVAVTLVVPAPDALSRYLVLLFPIRQVLPSRRTKTVKLASSAHRKTELMVITVGHDFGDAALQQEFTERVSVLLDEKETDPTVRTLMVRYRSMFGATARKT